MGWGGWGSIIGAALGGLGGYLGGKDAAKQKGPWSKKHQAQLWWCCNGPYVQNDDVQ
jgi:hypothetical protein